MASYATLLEKTRVPQPSIQRLAVISVFSKFRSAPEPESETGREAISFCLTSESITVVDQSVRELCRLVADSVLDLSRGLLELQSALEGCDSRLVPIFVKGLGFLIRIGYKQRDGNWKFNSTENHPFVRILSCRVETQTELIRQVSLFVMRNRRLGMVGVCEFLEPFVNFVILRVPFADSSPSLFVRELVSSMASLCCSCRHEALPVFRLLMRCLKYVPGKNSEDNRNFSCIVKTLVDAYTVVARDLVGSRLEVVEVHVLGVQLVDTVLLLCASPHVQNTEQEAVIESLRHLLAVQKDLGLPYSRDLSLVVLSLVFMLAKSSVEHEQLSILKLLLFLLKWKSENENLSVRDAACSSVEPLLLFPIIALMSSPSKSVKGAASKVLSIVENVLVTMSNAPKIEVRTSVGDSPLSRVGSVVFTIMQQLWLQDDYAHSTSSFLRVTYINGSESQETYPGSVTWNSLLREHAKRLCDRKKLSASFCLSQEIPILLGAVAGVLVMHPSLGPDAIDSLTALGGIDPKMSVPLLLVVLYYSNLLSRTDVPCQSLLSKLLGLLPSLAAQQVMIPLVVQTITPMLHKDAKGPLYATAIRLLCQTWVVNDRAFSSLQEVLRPKGFKDFISERHICISMAASIEDVCKRHPDRGVDLILSVQACIESQDFSVRALGFQSLSHLCEADVIDFYTAWSVIEKHAQNIKLDPLLACSACLLLKWGAMDAEAYPEDAEKVLNILWEIGSSMQIPKDSKWTKARVSALMAFGQYEVSFLEKQISDFNKKCAYLLFSETHAKILNAIEDLSVKIIIHEHSVRRRYVREKKVSGSKIEKLLDVIPQVIFPAGKRIKTGELPGAALLCLSFSPKDVKLGSSKSFHDIHGQYEEAFKVVAKSLQLLRNISLALISLQSLRAFMSRWMRANILSLGAMATELSSDKTFKAANNIMKSLVYMAEETLPRSAENIALALGALCAVLPAAAHNIKATASKFLLGWLLEHEHEHRQWTAGISLGLISSSLHVTDHKQKFQNISGLLEVLCSSKSTLVKGACGVGLGFSCQDLLTRTEASASSDVDSESYKNQEEGLLGRIVRLLSSVLHHFLRTPCDVLESLSALFPLGNEDDVIPLTHLLDENSDDFDDDIWGIAGLIIGLGMSVGAIYRAGKKEAVVKIKNLIVSWIPYADSLQQTSGSNSNVSARVFSAGSCLALPLVITFCQKMELFDANEVDHLINCYKDLISELLIVKTSGAFHKSLLMASCIGAGDLLGSILNEGIHPVEIEPVKGLLELFKTCYSGLYPPVVHFGGMLGVVNILGAGAGDLVFSHPVPRAPSSSEENKISYVSGPVLSNSYLTHQLTPFVQEIFLIAQNTKDRQQQHYAAWAISFLRNYLRSRDASSQGNEIQSSDSQRSSISHNVPEHAMVMKLAQGLTTPSLPLAGGSLNIGALASALRCLSHAPRLPNLDWGATIRRLMRQETQPDVSQSGDIPKDISLREECLKFSLAHASEFDELLTFLDELSELSRFKALEQSLQSCLLCHLGDLMRMFSGSRMDKLFDDISCFVTSLSSDQVYSCDQKSSLRVSCWKGLSQCLEGTSFESSEYIAKIEKCIELLFSVLPVASQSPKVDQMGSVKEWSEAVRCLQQSHRDWLYKFLQVSSLEPGNGTDFHGNLKKIQAKAKLARLGSIPFSELGKLKATILNCEESDIWDVHVEIVAALYHAEGGIKRQWLIDAVEISCVSSYPSNAILFVGLLSSICCEYMPFLTLERSTVLRDMSVTVTSLLSDPNWEVVAEPFISFLWTSLERIYSFVTDSDANAKLTSQQIERSERDHAPMLVKVMHHICVAFRDHLPLEKQLRLAAMFIH